MEITLLIIGILLLLIGAAINIAINRSRFYRRGPGGLQHFESYSKSVIVTLKEKLGKVIAIILMITGLFLIASYFLLPNLKREIKVQKDLNEPDKG